MFDLFSNLTAKVTFRYNNSYRFSFNLIIRVIKIEYNTIRFQLSYTS